MSNIPDYIPTEEAIIVEPGNGTAPIISSLRPEGSQSRELRQSERVSVILHDGLVGLKMEPRESAHTTSPVPLPTTQETAPRAVPSSLDSQSAGRQIDVKQTSDFESDANRRQIDVKQTSLRGPRPDGRQSDVAQTSANQSRSQESPRAVKRQSRTQWHTDQDESGRYRHTIRLEPKIEDQLRIVAESLGVDMNAAISVCITAQYRHLKRTGNHGA